MLEGTYNQRFKDAEPTMEVDIIDVIDIKGSDAKDHDPITFFHLLYFLNW